MQKKSLTEVRSEKKSRGAKKAQGANKLSGRSETDPAILKVANRVFGITKLRPGQRELIEAALAGKDSLGIMPTGSGKSLCFQIPSLILKKTVLVISPLISLMQDQHEKLLELGISAGKINSTLSSGEEQELKESVAEGEKDIIYVTPERLENEDYVELLKKAEVGLIVVDEAHCISQWGHNFRPAYTALASAIARLGRPPLMALTATATEDVTEDIVAQLKMSDPLVLRHGVDRANLIFNVSNTVNVEQKKEKLLETITNSNGPGIVYVSTVKAAEQVAQMLCEAGIKATAYHGKLPTKRRSAVQDEFMQDKFKVIVATKAFGMGIDKPDVRFVIHYQFPDSVESYYQEAGRAGRDGKEALALLLYQLEDKRIQSYFLGGKYPNQSDVSSFLQSLKEAQESRTTVNMQALAEKTGIALNKLRVIANYLEGAGLIKKSRGLKVLKIFNSQEELENFLAEYQNRHQSDRQKLDDMMHYAQTMQCRVAFIQKYFGETEDLKCGRCDNCNAKPDNVAA
jgi:ATP-dependent DNA helicase RecQ